MATPSIMSATRAQEAQVIGVITMAFSTDPVARFAIPDPAQYLATMPQSIRAFGGRALDNGSAWCIEGFWGAALWLPPGATPDPLTMETVPESRRQMLREAFEQMGASHPVEPHWYLPLIGIDPSRQNRGLGSLLMEHANAVFDRSGALAYLESSNQRNVPFYQRHGYELLRTIQVGDCPPISPMLRRPRH
jgi:ribosomal protein S18 acetylase RimI-like enzyme